MRAIWNGVVSFGLVSVPVRLYSATTNHDVKFHQVHNSDGGRIRYKRVCEACGEEVDYADIVKGYETETGELVTLDEDDMASLPRSTSREIEVVEFVPAEQVDPLLMGRSYFLEPDPRAAKPYALLREALRQADQMAVAKVSLRQRERLALLRVRDRTIVMQTMLWPDEVRQPDFETLRTEVQLRPQELRMAASLVGTMGTDFDPTKFDDEYRAAVEELIDVKRRNGGARPAPAAAKDTGEPINDLLTALQRSVEEAAGRTGRQAGAKPGAKPGAKKAAGEVPRQRNGPKAPARKPAAAKTPAPKATPRKPAEKKPPEPGTPTKKRSTRGA